MPIYEYECEKCKKSFEVEQKLSEPKKKDCPQEGCTGEVKRLISPSSFVLKGGGWAKDGY